MSKPFRVPLHCALFDQKEMLTLDVEESADGPFLDYLDRDQRNQRRKVSCIKFPKINNCVALVQVYNDRTTGERMFYADHIPGDIVDFWRGNLGGLIPWTNPVEYKLGTQKILRENKENAQPNTSRIFLAGRYVDDEGLWNIFKDYHHGKRLASQTLVMDLMSSEHSATVYFNHNEDNPVQSWWHEISDQMSDRVPTQVPTERGKRCVVQ